MSEEVDEKVMASETKEAAEPYKPVDFKGEQSQAIGNDEVPIGKSTNKMMMDEFPPEGFVPKKAPVKKAAKKQPNPPPEEEKPIVNLDDVPIKPAGGGGVLDELPVGGGNKFAISEYPEGMEGGGEEVQQTVLPLAQRLKSKAWKLRQSAFEEMAELFQKDEALEEYFEEWPKLINDNNPGSQEKALVALQIFISKANKGQFQARFDAKETIRVLIDKCIAPGKKQIVKVSYDIFFDIFERRDKQEMFDVVIEMLRNKVQKVQCAAIQSIVELLSTFGPKRLDYLKPFFGEIEKLAQSTVSSIKTECMNFYKEAHKWLGEPILAPFIKGLKKLQQEELEKFQKEWQPTPMVPTRGGESVTVGQGGGANNGLDAYDLVDAVDILGKFNEKWCEKVLAQTKWNEKLALLEQLVKEASTPKIAPGNYVPMIAMIKKLLQDSNQVINQCAIKLCGVFVKGLRKNFTQQAKILFPLLMVKLREKKNICQEARTSMELFHYCIQVEDVVEDFKEGLADKNPQMKAQTILLFAKLVQLKGFPQGAPKPKFLDCVKALLPLAKKLIEDSVPDVREAAVQSIGTLKPYLPEQLMSQQLADVAAQKLAKINEIASQIEEEKKKEQQKNKPQQAPQKEPQQSVVQQSSVQQVSKKPPLSQKSNIVINEQPEVGIEQLEQLLRSYGVDDAFFENMNGMAKQKAEAIKMLENYIDAMLYHFEDVLGYLKIKLKDWREANLSINKELFAMLIYANDLDPKPFTQKSFQPLGKLLVEKMTDSKFREDIYIILKGCCSCVNPNYVVMYLMSLAVPKDDKETGKVIAVPPQKAGEVIVNIAKIIDIVTIKNVPAKEVIDFGKEQIQSTNAIIKNACLELFKTIYKYIGQDLLQFLQDIQPQVMKTLTVEFEKVVVLTQYEPSITFSGEAAKECGVIQQVPLSQSIVQSSVVINDNLPRADISNSLQSVLKKMADIQWNKRKEGIEELDKILSLNNNRIQMNGLSDLINMLKQRLSDNNKQLVRPIVQIVGRVAEACGKDFKSQGKLLIQPLISIFSDKQVLVRQDVAASLEKFCAAIGTDQVIIQMPPYLQMESIELKQEVLLFLLKYVDQLLKQDYKPFILPLINCLCDRVKEVRQAAEQVCERMVEDVGINPFVNQIQDLKPAVVQQVKQFFSKYGMSDLEESQKRTGKTPKGKQQQQQQQDIRNMKRNLTTKDLQGDLNTSQEPKQRNERTPKKSLHQKSHKTLPQDGTPLRQPKEKAIFQDSNSLVATALSTRELKLARLQADQISQWTNDQFPSTPFNDFHACLRDDLYHLIMSHNYKDVMKAIQQLTTVCNDPVQKLDIIELSDLLLKYSLVKIYGLCGNELLQSAILSFLDLFFRIISKTRYLLTEVEQIVTISIIREFIYADIEIPPELLMNIQCVFPGELIVKRLVHIFAQNPQNIHPFLVDQQERVNNALSKVIVSGQLTKFFTPDIIPEYSQFYNKDLINELISLFGESTLRKINYQQQQQQPQYQQQYKQPVLQATVQLQPAKDPRSQQFLSILDSLQSQQTSQKIESLMQISDLLTQNIQQNQSLFVDNAEAICKCFQTLLQNTFNQRETYPAQFIQFFLQALNKLYQLKPYVNILPYDLLCGFTEEIMQRLLTEDEIKQQHENGDATVKQLNSTTLRILENTSQDIMFSILFDILTKYRRRSNQSKIIGLLVKCIARLSAKIEPNSNIKIELLLLKFHNYLNEFQLYPNFAPDEPGVKTIKVVLQQLVKLRGEAIWENYHLVSRSSQQDQYLNKWIQAYLGNPSLQDSSDQELLQIAEMIKQPTQLEQGIKKMVEKIKKNPNLHWQKYVPDQQIQLLIQQQLNNNQSVALGGYVSNQSLQQSQLQQSQLQQSQLQQSQLQQSQLQQTQFQQQSTQLQQSQFQQSQLQQLQQQQQFQSYPRTTRGSDSQQFADQMNGQFNQFMSVNQYQLNQNQMGQQQNVKTPEYLMQKLTDMKNKVQTLVGPNNQQQIPNNSRSFQNSRLQQ